MTYLVLSDLEFPVSSPKFWLDYLFSRRRQDTLHLDGRRFDPHLLRGPRSVERRLRILRPIFLFYHFSHLKR